MFRVLCRHFRLAYNSAAIPSPPKWLMLSIKSRLKTFSYVSGEEVYYTLLKGQDLYWAQGWILPSPIPRRKNNQSAGKKEPDPRQACGLWLARSSAGCGDGALPECSKQGRSNRFSSNCCFLKAYIFLQRKHEMHLFWQRANNFFSLNHQIHWEETALGWSCLRSDKSTRDDRL